LKDKKNYVINGLKLVDSKLLWLAWKLLSIFLKSKLIDWSMETGAVIYGGSPIENSNIVELMRCLLEKNMAIRSLLGLRVFGEAIMNNPIAKKLIHKDLENFLKKQLK